MRHRLTCTAALFGGTAVLALPAALAPWRGPAWAGLGAALALALPSYWTLAPALRRSNRAFFSAFIGGGLFRLAGLAAAAAWARLTGRPVAVVALACVGGLIVLSFIEMYFLQKEA